MAVVPKVEHAGRRLPSETGRIFIDTVRAHNLICPFKITFHRSSNTYHSNNLLLVYEGRPNIIRKKVKSTIKVLYVIYWHYIISEANETYLFLLQLTHPVTEGGSQIRKNHGVKNDTFFC